VTSPDPGFIGEAIPKVLLVDGVWPDRSPSNPGDKDGGWSKLFGIREPASYRADLFPIIFGDLPSDSENNN
jgi:hypothetical protein